MVFWKWQSYTIKKVMERKRNDLFNQSNASDQQNQSGKELTDSHRTDQNPRTWPSNVQSNSSDNTRRPHPVTAPETVAETDANPDCQTDPDWCICYLINVVIEIFTKATAYEYDPLSEFLKRVLKQILLRKFQFPNFQFGDDRLEHDEPFDSETVKEIAEFNTPKRDNEKLNFLISKFVIYMQVNLHHLQKQKENDQKKSNQPNTPSPGHFGSEGALTPTEPDDMTKKATFADFERPKEEPQRSDLRGEFECLKQVKNYTMESFFKKIETLPKIQKALIEFLKNKKESLLARMCIDQTEHKVPQFLSKMCRVIREKECGSAESRLDEVKAYLANSKLKLPSHINDVLLIANKILNELVDEVS